MSTSPGVKDRVVIAIGPGRGLCGVITGTHAMKIHGRRTHVLTDDGSEFWFQDYQQDALVAESSDEGQAIRQEYEECLGPVDLAADVAFVRRVIDENLGVEIYRAIDRIVRHADDEALSVLLDLVAFQLSPAVLAAKPPGWVSPSLRALINHRTHPNPAPTIAARLRRWWDDPGTRLVCGTVADALCENPDPAILEALREICQTTPDPQLISARLKAGDDTAYADLSQQRCVERDGRLELDVGDLQPATAARILDLIGEKINDLVQLNLVRQGRAAFGGVDLNAWLAWPELRRFQRLDFSAGFVGKKGLEALVKSPHLSPEIEYLDLGSCDVGQGGCSVLAKSKALSTLKELCLDSGDHDRSKWTSQSLQRLFPKKGSTLIHLEALSIRGWDVTATEVVDLVESGRAPALRSVQLTGQKVELQDPQ